MYRSYSVNNMPQPIRYHGSGNSNAHTDNIGADCPAAENPRSESCRSEVQPVEDKQGAECQQPAQNLPQNCPARNCAVQNCPAHPNNNGGLLAGLNLKNDDVILLAVAFILLMDGCDDKLLLAALGLVFFSDYFGF